MQAKHLLLGSPALGRRAHLWRFGHGGRPVIVFPSNAGVAHEWQKSGMVDALGPWLARGQLTLYCPESNVSQTFSADGAVDERMARHHRYERFVLETLVPFIQRERGEARVLATGCSMGALYSALFALKFPDVFRGALCLSGRYSGARVNRGPYGEPLYFNDPLAFVPNLEGAALDRVRQTHLTLVVGQGAFENSCIPETVALGRWLSKKRIPSFVGLWGTESRHDYTWWRRQVTHYLPQLM